MSDKIALTQVFSRCMTSKCPVCGQGRLFERITHLRHSRHLFLPLDHCETCHFQFGRQPGYYFGVVTPILPMLSLAMGGIISGIAYFGFHEEIETVLICGMIGVGIGFFLFFRTAIAIYIALDHAIDPPEGKPLRNNKE